VRANSNANPMRHLVGRHRAARKPSSCPPRIAPVSCTDARCSRPTPRCSRPTPRDPTARRSFGVHFVPRQRHQSAPTAQNLTASLPTLCRIHCSRASPCCAQSRADGCNILDDAISLFTCMMDTSTVSAAALRRPGRMYHPPLSGARRVTRHPRRSSSRQESSTACVRSGR